MILWLFCLCFFLFSTMVSSRSRPSWREERALNSETFGAPSVAAARRFHHGRHGRGGWRGGGGGGYRRGGGGGANGIGGQGM